MNDRVQRVLDGELDRRALDPGERAELADMEALIGGVLQSSSSNPMPDLAPAVMTRIEKLARKERAPSWRRLTAWFWAPRPVALAWRPAYGLAAVGAVALFLTLGAPPDAPREGEGAILAPHVFVQFRLDAPGARQVELAGGFTAWRPAYALTRSDAGIWTVVVPLEPGVHDYAFIVDGERWVPDPMAPSVADGFGGLNSRLAILTPDPGRPL